MIFVLELNHETLSLFWMPVI